MKVILEQPDLIHILEEHFGSAFEPGDIVVRASPFEVEVRNVPVPASEKSATPLPPPRTAPLRTTEEDLDEELARLPRASAEDTELVARRADADASPEPPPPGNDETATTDISGSPLSVIQQSQELERQLERERNGASPRRRGGSSKAPTNFQDEV